jgi:integrase/recombinase XerD
MPQKPIPDPVILPLPAISTPQTSVGRSHLTATDLRHSQVDEFLQARSLSVNSQRAYRQDLQRFLDWTKTEWAQITQRHVAQFKAYLTQEKQLAPATVNRALTTLKNFYNWLVESDQVLENPTTAVSLLKLTEPEPQSLSQEEVQQILAIAQVGLLAERDVALISVMLHGLRAEEAAALNIGDYDGTRLQIREGEHDTQGFVPLKAQARQALDIYLAWRQQQEALSSDRPLFVSYSRRSQGQRLSYWGIRNVVDRIAKAANIPLHTHRFRHTFATDLVLKGMNVNHIMTLTRHKSLQSFRRYTKPTDPLTAEQAFYQAIAEEPTTNETGG